MNNSYSSVTASKSYFLRCYNLTIFSWYGYSYQIFSNILVSLVMSYIVFSLWGILWILQ